MSDNSRVRVSIIGVVIVALFGSLFARLWFLQMGPGDALKVQAVLRSTRVVQTEMPRGRIFDRNGTLLVGNRVAWALTMDRDIPDKQRAKLFGQLAELLGGTTTPSGLESRYKDLRQSPLKPAIIAVDVPEPVRLAILEHVDLYPGVHVVKLTVRAYGENASLAAQVLGYVGEISSDQLTQLRDDGYQEGDEVGRAGAEAAFERDLRGRPQRETLEVDPTGRQVGPPRDVRPGTLGHDVYLTIDANTQRVAEESLIQGIASARTLKNDNVVKRYEKLKATSGALIVLDVTDGSVIAMASFPTYDPSMFVGGITQTEYDALQDPVNANPLLNRATDGLYAPGSTLKLATAVATTRYGIRSANQSYLDRGYYETGDKRRLYNAKKTVFGPVNLSRAITVSSDAYFYSAGNEFWKRWKAGDVASGLGIQTVAKEFGFGAPTGIELGEVAGLVPDPQWKHDFVQAYYKSDADRRANEPWFPGDNINVAIGQGDTLSTPLQLANAYATFANGGTRWKPHLGLQVKDVDQSVVRQITAEPAGQVAIDPVVRAQMLQGFKGAIAEKRGTAYDAFVGFPLKDIPIAGKTGTAQVQDKGDSSIFAAFWPADAPKYVALAVVEEGGYGAQTAAPMVRRVIESMNNLAAPPVKAIERGHD